MRESERIYLELLAAARAEIERDGAPHPVTAEALSLQRLVIEGERGAGPDESETFAQAAKVSAVRATTVVARRTRPAREGPSVKVGLVVS